jgi:hypothetical protein
MTDGKIALPDVYSSPQNLRRVLKEQGYGLQKLSLVQPVRILDIFIIAPVLMYASTKIEDKPLKTGVFIIGLCTLLYNGYNYINNLKKGK